MDIFVKNLVSIRAVARKAALRYGNRYQVDELVNVAYIGYDRAITNKPSLLETFKKITSLLFRVKSDIIDYIRHDTQFRRKNKLNVTTCSFRPSSEEESSWEPSCTEKVVLEDIEEANLLLMNTTLTDDEWFIIQQYFYEDVPLKTVGKRLGLGESAIWKRRAKMYEKLLACAETLV
jgi:RNA polymerase sigma factor (sigma-70 family)